MLSKSELITAISDYSHTMLSKSVGAAGAAAASVQLSSSWFDNVYQFLYDFPWINSLSAIAVILLVIERAFIVWAWNNRRKRGEL